MGPPSGKPVKVDQEKQRQNLIGIGLGMIPVVVLWIALGVGARATGGSSSNVATGIGVFGGILYGVEIIAAIVCLFNKRVHSIGSGLLAMVFVGPVVWSAGCIVILSTHA
jgi:hypothetical protein